MIILEGWRAPLWRYPRDNRMIGFGPGDLAGNIKGYEINREYHQIAMDRDALRD